METFESRINLDFPLEVLAKKVCTAYSLGEFFNCKIITTGYEDFNFILNTASGKFVVKIFSKSRTFAIAKNLLNRLEVAYNNGISCPKIIKTKANKNLLSLKFNKIKFNLFVMEYIDGEDFFAQNAELEINELEFVAKELAKLNSIDYNPPFIYDQWAIINFEKEYNKNIHFLDNNIKPLINKAYSLFKSIKFDKLSYGFVHGDIIKTNIIKRHDKKLFLIDFSVSNFQPKIVDIAISVCELCTNKNKKQTQLRTQKFIESYESISPLNNYDKECLKIFMICHEALSVLETTREKIAENNNSHENNMFYENSLNDLKVLLNTKN